MLRRAHYINHFVHGNSAMLGGRAVAVGTSLGRQYADGGCLLNHGTTHAWTHLTAE